MGKFSDVKYSYTINELQQTKKDGLIEIIKKLEIEIKYFKKRK